jgi:hypothetical protein
MNLDIEKIKAAYNQWNEAPFIKEESELYFNEDNSLALIAFLAGYKAALEDMSNAKLKQEAQG